jgi:hypothetical protein
MRLSTLIILAGIVAASLLVPSTPAVAQQGIVSIDHIDCVFFKDTIVAAPKTRFVIRFTNNTPERVDIGNGWRVHSPDGIAIDSVTIDTIGYQTSHQSVFASYFNMAFALMHGPYWSYVDTVAVLGSGNPIRQDTQLPVGYSDTVLAITVWTGGSAAQQDLKHLCIDSSFFQPGGEWMWVGRSLDVYHPTFVGTSGVSYVPGSGYCYIMYHVCDPVLTTAPSVSSKGPSPMLNPACACSCCNGKTGDLNSDGYVNLGDLAGMVAYLTGTGYYPACFDEANVSYWGMVDLTDLSILVAYLTGLPVALADCH